MAQTYPERSFFGYDPVELDALDTEDEEVKEEKKTEKKRIEVIWNELKFEFVWRVGTPPQLLVFRLSRMLDPLADPGRLILHYPDGSFADLCDTLESDVSLQAKFLDHHPQPVMPLPVAPAPIVTSPVGGGGYSAPPVIPPPVPGQSVETASGAKRSPAAGKSAAAPSTLKRKRATPAVTGPAAPPSTREDEYAKYQRDGFLLLRKVVRKAVKNSRYLNGTGVYGVYPQLHHHKTYSAWKDHARTADIYKLMRAETDRLAFHPEILTVMHQFSLQPDALSMALETYFRSNRGAPKDGVTPKPPRCDPAAELDLAVVTSATGAEGRVSDTHLMEEHVGLEEPGEDVLPQGYSHDPSVLDSMVADFNGPAQGMRGNATSLRQAPPVGPTTARITASLGYTLTPMTLGFVTTHGSAPHGEANGPGTWHYGQCEEYAEHDGTAGEYPHESVVDSHAYDHGSTDV